MTVGDPIADMLTRIRNALARRAPEVCVPSSKLKEAIVRVLEEEGYIAGYEVEKLGSYPVLRIKLKYLREGTRVWRPAIRGLRRVSRPSRRVYAGVRELPRPYQGLGIAIVSTPQGVMTDREARRRRIGGEILCEVW
ncbi:MAG: 30S ribosomal protein S8 [Candidatus Bipolaricaulota bacterium]|nr:30S ribosomal protein S8 [Candidatus Bipolaricaulota bacterium]MDW8126288.1 30S ribosomal protein S8 [Candidatus Bipolaricaulota bacterium]